MNEAVALTPQDVGAVGLDDLLAVLALPSQRRSMRELPASIADVVNGVNSFIDGLLLRAIAAQTKNAFVESRQDLFPVYAKAVIALGKLVKVAVPEDVIERTVDESFCELEAELREQALASFGPAAKDQAMFTVWTFRRTSGLISKLVAAGPIPKDLKGQDEDLAASFGIFATWARFNLDCLLAAIRWNKPIQLEVLPDIIDGLRAAVNAYGYARQGLDLRVPEEELLIESQEWDDEDQELLDSSMKDMDVETLDD